MEQWRDTQRNGTPQWRNVVGALALSLFVHTRFCKELPLMTLERGKTISPRKSKTLLELDYQRKQA